MACIEFHNSCSNGNLDRVKILVANNSTIVNSTCQLEGDDGEWERDDDEHDTGLIRATKNGQYGVIEWLFTVPGIDVNKTGRARATALHWAISEAWKSCKDILELFLANEDVLLDIGDENGDTPLMLAELSDTDPELFPLIASAVFKRTGRTVSRRFTSATVEAQDVVGDNDEATLKAQDIVGDTMKAILEAQDVVDDNDLDMNESLETLNDSLEQMWSNDEEIIQEEEGSGPSADKKETEEGKPVECGKVQSIFNGNQKDEEEKGNAQTRY